MNSDATTAWSIWDRGEGNKKMGGGDGGEERWRQGGEGEQREGSGHREGGSKTEVREE